MRSACVVLLAVLGVLSCTRVSAQEAPDSADMRAVEDPAHRSLQSIGGMPEMSPRRIENPVKKLGIDLGVGFYALSALSSLVYLVAVYPLQAIFGSSRVEPVMLWLFLPIAGPWFAQYEDSVKDKPVWRGILIADACLQATGLVLGLIGAAIGDSYEYPSSRQSRQNQLELKLGLTGMSLTYRAF
jgi:hypothetical protein